MRKYRITAEAKADLQRIYSHGLKNWGEEQADKYFNAFFEHFELIAKQPELYQSVEHIRTGYRRCVCGVDSIYYRVVNNTVEIISIIGSQDFNEKL